jgi:hypothetical protein
MLKKKHHHTILLLWRTTCQMEMLCSSATPMVASSLLERPSSWTVASSTFGSALIFVCADMAAVIDSVHELAWLQILSKTDPSGNEGDYSRTDGHSHRVDLTRTRKGSSCVLSISSGASTLHNYTWPSPVPGRRQSAGPIMPKVVGRPRRQNHAESEVGPQFSDDGVFPGSLVLHAAVIGTETEECVFEGWREWPLQTGGRRQETQPPELECGVSAKELNQHLSRHSAEYIKVANPPHLPLSTFDSKSPYGFVKTDGSGGCC